MIFCLFTAQNWLIYSGQYSPLRALESIPEVSGTRSRVVLVTYDVDGKSEHPELVEGIIRGIRAQQCQ